MVPPVPDVPPHLAAVWRQADELRAHGDVPAAIGVLEPAAEVASLAYGSDSPATLQTLHRLAVLYRLRGDLAAARRVLDEAQAGGEHRFGDDDPLMLAIAGELGAVAEELGNRHEARRNWGKVAHYGPDVLGPEHPRVRAARAYLQADPAGPVYVPPERPVLRRPEPSGYPQAPEPHGPPSGPSAETTAEFSAPAPRRPADDLDLTPPPPPPTQPPPSPPPSTPPQPQPQQADPDLGAWPVQRTDAGGPVTDGGSADPGQPRTGPWDPAVGPNQPATGPNPPATWPNQPGTDLNQPGNGPNQPAAGVWPSAGPAWEAREHPAPSPRVAWESPVAPDPVEHGVWRMAARPEAPYFPPDLSEELPPEPHGRAVRTVLLVCAIVLLVVLALLVGGLLQRRADRPSAGSGTGGSAAPESSEPTALGQHRPPLDVKLRDNADHATLTWTDPSNGTLPFIVNGGRAGQELRTYATLPAGSTSYPVSALNANYDYCFVVIAVYSVNDLVASDLTCTHRHLSPSPSG